jgi:DNA-binding NarL/FixJ family response regulator
VLSVRTVDRHVSRIFEKLGVKSRIAAASEYQRARSGEAPAGPELREAL